MKFIVTLPDGSKHDVAAKPGDRLMQSMRAAGVPIMGDCGGAMACATCHVHIADAWLPKVGPASQEEADLLDMSNYKTPASRLSCQVAFKPELDGLEVALQLDAFEG